jgi:hypothetical protein
MVWRNKTRAAAARAWRDHGLLFDFKVLVDVFTVNPQLACAVAIWARRAHESTRFFAVGNAHSGLLIENTLTRLHIKRYSQKRSQASQAEQTARADQLSALKLLAEVAFNRLAALLGG